MHFLRRSILPGANGVLGSIEGESLYIVVDPMTIVLSLFLLRTVCLSKDMGVCWLGPTAEGARGPPGRLSDCTAETRGAKYDS